jgi:NDP-sugar pyrophosphorylase family protein
MEIGEIPVLLNVGGKGSRFREVSPWPKALAGTPTLLDTTMENLLEAGFGRFIFLTSQDGESQNDLVTLHVKAFYGPGKDVKTKTPPEFSEERSPLGTAGAIRLALEKTGDGIVVDINPDTIFPIEKILDINPNHPGMESIIWMATSHKADSQQNQGKILCDPASYQIVHVLEGENSPKIDDEERNRLLALTSGGVLLINSGYYKKKFDAYMSSHPEKSGKPVSVYGDLIRWLVETGEKVYTFDVKSEVIDVGTKEMWEKYMGK